MKISERNWLNEVYGHFYTSIRSPIENIEASIKKEDTIKAILDLGKRILKPVKKYEDGKSLTLDKKVVEKASEPVRRIIYRNNEYQLTNLLLKEYNSIFPTSPNQFIVLNSLQEIIDNVDSEARNKIKKTREEIAYHVMSDKELSSDKTIEDLALLCWQVYTSKEVAMYMKGYDEDKEIKRKKYKREFNKPFTIRNEKKKDELDRDYTLAIERNEEKEDKYFKKICNEYDPLLFTKIKGISLRDINKNLNPQTLDESKLVTKIFELVIPSSKEELSSFQKTIEYAKSVYLNPNNEKIDQVKNIVTELRKKRISHILYDLGAIKIDEKTACIREKSFASWIYSLVANAPTKYGKKEIDYYLTKKQEEIVQILFNNKKYNLLDRFFVESITKNYEAGH